MDYEMNDGSKLRSCGHAVQETGSIMENNIANLIELIFCFDC